VTGRLSANRYGKAGVRLATVDRRDGTHAFRDLTVDVLLSGDGFTAAHSDGDNAEVLPTDSMRGAVYGLAREHEIGAVEEFGRLVADHCLSVTSAADRAEVTIVEQPWQRIAVDGQPHPWAFERAAGGLRTAHLTRLRDGDGTVHAGVTDLYLCKTTKSGFSGFLRDRFTTLEETDDRIMATRATARWRYAGGQHDFDALHDDVLATLREAFAGHDSASVQHTAYAMGEAVLAAHDAVDEIAFTLPNLHHVLVDLSAYGLDNPGAVFVATDRPFGVIEATVSRDR
jgi:urate oxidase